MWGSRPAGDRVHRIESALAGGVADRPPVSAWGHLYDVEWTPDVLAGRLADNARRYDWDWVKLQNRESCFAEALGCSYRPSPTGLSHPVMTNGPVEEAADWDSVIELALSDELPPALREQVHLLERVIAHLDGDRPVLQTVFSPLSVIGYLCGRNQQRAVDWLRNHPGRIEDVMAAISTLLQRFICASLQAGAAGIYYAVIGYASGPYLGLGEYRRHVLPADTATLAAARSGWFNIGHLCFDEIHFDLFDDLDVHAASWSCTDPGNPSMAAARERTAMPLVGGLDRRSPIADGEPEQVLHSVCEVMAGVDGGLLLTPGCSVSPWPTDRDLNMYALRLASAAHPRGHSRLLVSR